VKRTIKVPLMSDSRPSGTLTMGTWYKGLNLAELTNEQAAKLESKAAKWKTPAKRGRKRETDAAMWADTLHDDGKGLTFKKISLLSEQPEFLKRYGYRDEQGWQKLVNRFRKSTKLEK